MWIADKIRNLSRARDRPEEKPAKPNYGLMRNIGRVRGDHAMATSEAIYAAVSRISNTVAMLPMHLYKGNEVQHNDPRERLVGYAPNANMTGYVYQQTMEAFRNTEGNAYALLVPTPDDTAIKALDVLDAARVEPVKEIETGEIWYKFTTDGGVTMTVHNMRMIALHHVSANGARGIRPIDVLRDTLDYDRQIKEFSLRQLEGVNCGVVLNVPGTGLNKEKKDAIISQFLRAYRESGGRLVVLEGGITATSLTGSPIDAKVLDVERITKNRVATVYNIPPHMLGDYSDTSYSTAEQSLREYLDLCILPIVTQWEQEYNRKLLTWRECTQGYRFRFDVRAMLRADTGTMAEMYQKAVRSSWMTPNEVRAFEGLPPDQNGYELMASRDLLPLKVALTGKYTPGVPAPGREGENRE